MHVDQLIARVRSRIATMQTAAEEYEIEARFHADKALDLRLGVMELNQLINSVREFVDGEPDETPADSRPGSEATSAEADLASAGEVFPSASPAPNSAEAPTDETGTASSSDNLAEPVFSRGTWVQAEVDADNEEQDLVEVLAHEKAPDPAPAGGAATSPAPTTKERVKALHAEHPGYTRRQACEALGITEGSLAGHGHAQGIRWAPSPAVKLKAGQPPTAPEPPGPAVQYASGSTGDRVRIVHQQHPNWTARLIANHLGAAEKTVANILGELRRQAKASPPQEFAGRAEMVGHYSDVAKRLGKV